MNAPPGLLAQSTHRVEHERRRLAYQQQRRRALRAPRALSRWRARGTGVAPAGQGCEVRTATPASVCTPAGTAVKCSGTGQARPAEEVRGSSSHSAYVSWQARQADAPRAHCGSAYA